MQRAFADVYEEITSQYLLGYSPLDQHYDGEGRDIEIKLDPDKGLKVRGREGYRAVASN